MEAETPDKADSAEQSVRGQSQPGDASVGGGEKAEPEGIDELMEAYQLQVADQMAKEIKKKLRKKLKEQLTYFPSDTLLHDDDELGSEKQRKKKKKRVPAPPKPATRYFTLPNRSPLQEPQAWSASYTLTQNISAMFGTVTTEVLTAGLYAVLAVC